MRRLAPALVPLALFVACKRAPSAAEELARTQTEVAETLPEVQRSFDRLRALRSRIDTPTPPCTAPADPALLRLTWNALRALTGDPFDGLGNVEGEPAPRVPAPPIWDDRRLREMGSPTQLRTTPEPKGLARKQLLDGHALVEAAPGFLVSRTDLHVPPDLAKPSGEWGGRVEGRAVVFDAAGTPTCHYRFVAETPRAPAADPRAALDAELGRVIDAAVAMRTDPIPAPSNPAAPDAQR